MDKPQMIVWIVIGLIVVLAILFYTNAGENHRTIAVALCQLKCDNLSASAQLPNNYCISNNISYGYACAVSTTENASVCTGTSKIYIGQDCKLS